MRRVNQILDELIPNRKINLTRLEKIFKNLSIVDLTPFVFFSILGLPVVALGQWKAATPMSPSAKATEYASITPEPTPIKETPKGKHHNALPDTYMRPYKIKVMGLSSANAPEKYVRKVMFDIPGGLNDKYGWPPTFTCRVDGKENVYLTYQRAVVVVDKSGKVVRVIENLSSISSPNILVDEDGNLFIREYGVGNGQVIISIRVFDSDGILIDQPNIKNWHEFEGPDVRFAHGVIYSAKTGGVLYKLPKANEKIIQNKFIKDLKFQITGDRPTQYEADENNNWLPRRIDGFDFEQIEDVDDFGDIYAMYETGSLGGEHPVWSLNHLYKFNPKFRLLAGFDFYPDDINLQTGNIYHVEKKSISEPYGRIVKWEKPIKQLKIQN